MVDEHKGARLANLWDKARAEAMSESERLIYRSNLLGSDKRITNYGGGNTSAKVMEKDPLTGAMVEVMWVKGSGGDVGTIKRDGFATLYMDRLQALKQVYRGVDFEDEMVDYLPHCTFNLNPRAASIDTPLHAYVPKKHVDHMHPDAIIAIAASQNSRELTQQIFGGEIGWLPWKRPGYELGLWLEKFCLENPAARGVVLESHGLFTWGDTAEESYLTTIEIINTDAEGRLVLADVLWYVATKFKPKFMIDLATLTGAIMVALGTEHAGLFSNNDDLADKLLKAGQETGEKVWRMPLGPEYDKLIDSQFADMKNTGGSRQAGAITAAQFLQRFVSDTPWAHLDIAGTAMGAPKSEINQSWGSGYGVRLLDRLVWDAYEAKA